MLGAHGPFAWTRIAITAPGRLSFVWWSIGLAIFGKNKQDDSETGGSVAGDGDRPEIQPAKAKAWFSQAKTVQETGSYDYAMTC